MEAIEAYYKQENLYAIFRPPSAGSPGIFGYWVNTFWDDDQDATHHRSYHTLDEDDLFIHLRNLHDQAAGPALTLVSLDHGSYDGIAISESAFQQLLDFCNIELPLMSTFYHGFNEGINTITLDDDNSSCDTHLGHGISSTLHTNMASVDLYKLIWTFNPSTSRALGILLLASPFASNPTSGLPPTFSRLLTSINPPYSIPNLLPYVCTVDLLESIRARSPGAKILTIERQLNYAVAIQDQDVKEEPLPRISRVSLSIATQRIAAARFSIDEATAIRIAVSELVHRLRDRADIWWTSEAAVGPSPSSTHSNPNTAEERAKRMREIRNAAQLIALKVNEYESLHPMQRARLDTLSSIVFHMMTQRDAEEGIELARASKELAVAAGRDASSMKTIAVVTMAFLPGTFFAGLFALPSLRFPSSSGEHDDKEGNVASEGFWVYLYFAIPCTVVVFLIWGVMNHEGPIRRWMVRRKVGGRRWIGMERQGGGVGDERGVGEDEEENVSFMEVSTRDEDDRENMMIGRA